MGITISKSNKKAGKPAPTNFPSLYILQANFARRFKIKSIISGKIGGKR
jgi:hypothetical protein